MAQDIVLHLADIGGGGKTPVFLFRFDADVELVVLFRRKIGVADSDVAPQRALICIGGAGGLGQPGKDQNAGGHLMFQPHQPADVVLVAGRKVVP